MIEDAKGGMDEEQYMSGKGKYHLLLLPFILLSNLAYLQLLCYPVIHVFHERHWTLHNMKMSKEKALRSF